MKRIPRFRKRTWVLLAVLATVAAMASVGAYAYFTATGSGTGTATVGSASNIQLSSPVVGNLYPAGADVPVTVTLSRPPLLSARSIRLRHDDFAEVLLFKTISISSSSTMSVSPSVHNRI